MNTNGHESDAAPRESFLFGVSGRGWLAGIVVITMCIMAATGVEITEPFKSFVLVAMGWAFGSRK